MCNNDNSGQESDGEHCCPVEGCNYSTTTLRGRNVHIANSHSEEVVEKHLTDEIVRLYDEYGRPPRTVEMDQSGKYNSATYLNRFGSWGRALDAAGVSRPDRYHISDEELFDELRRLKDDLGRTPTSSDMQEVGKYDLSTYQRRFDSWNDALKSVGFSLHARPGISREELVEELRSVAEELGRTPSLRDMHMFSCSSGPFLSIFGSWNAAVESAGLVKNTRKNIPDEEYLDEIQRLADEFGRTPTHDEMDEFGDVSGSNCVDRFGSWTAALVEAGFTPPSQSDWAISGPDHPKWQGGTFPYGEGWTETKKEQVRERDGRVCQNPGCGRTESEHLEMFGTKHHVHHIQKARSFDDSEKRNHPDNLVTLCVSKECHQLWEKMSPLRPQGAGDN